jgi:hypothetical protein
MVWGAEPGRCIYCEVLKERLGLRILQERLLEMEGNVCEVPVFGDAGIVHRSYLPDIG